MLILIIFSTNYSKEKQLNKNEQSGLEYIECSKNSVGMRPKLYELTSRNGNSIDRNLLFSNKQHDNSIEDGMEGGEPPPPTLPLYSEADLDLLARVIYAEADDNILLDRQFVGNVVINRVNSNKFPNTIREVVYAGNGRQYGCIKGRKFKLNPPEQCYEIARALLEGERFCPENVVFQAQFKQGSGVYKKVGVHYYCYQ